MDQYPSHSLIKQGANHATVQVSRIALVLLARSEAGDAPAFVVGIELELEANGVFDATNEAHAGVRLFLHDYLFVPSCSMV
jgi:hypothetical protein